MSAGPLRFVRQCLGCPAADAKAKGRIGGKAQEAGNAQGAEGAAVTKKLAELKKKKPKVGTDYAAFKRSKAKIAADIEETQAEQAYREAVKAEHDEAAQEITRETARNYDQRALQSPVVVSRDGVVLSGNGRTMAGEIAAREGTDSAYTDLPYTAETFAKFNRTDQKSQTKTGQAVKMGKVVDDTT